MNILIDGSGAIGIGLGCSMLDSGYDVSFYASERTAKAMENGISRIGLFKQLEFAPDMYEVYTKYEDIPDNQFDYIFVASKTIANEDISLKLHENARILKDDYRIVIFQNGFGNDEYYLKYFPKEKVFCARVITGFSRPERNVSEVTVYTEPILLGSLQGEDPGELENIAQAITDSGIKCEISYDLDKYLWAKMLYNCALNPLGAILGVNYGKLTENEYSKSIMNRVIAEIFDVIDAAGYETLWKSPEEYEKVFYSKLVPDTYNHYSSTYQDISKKNKTEIDNLTGKVIAIGDKYGINVDVNRTLYNMIKSIESDY
ncbi:MAG: ketopantoate reductase family protein [Methanobrevibacter sp.]|uniref:ketopantoate reductase family protein n=1 Tax=Methanobrevibacter sp. TaxID=66852 RepID=UPI0026DF3AE3|nr:ketopantoate reductase family protein [Methanobrevibacter sp.]MDO5849473.1 ketopantoate reductase family protein [Methanobrevibacter sp.]